MAIAKKTATKTVTVKKAEPAPKKVAVKKTVSVKKSIEVPERTAPKKASKWSKIVFFDSTKIIISLEYPGLFLFALRL